MQTVPLHYRVLGEGFPLLIIHGLFGSSDNWQSLAKSWANHRKVYLLDMRNHGRSPWADDFNYTVMANDVADFCHQQRLTHSDFIGHSMGGKIVMNLAMQHPALISKMMVIDIAPKKYPVHHDVILDGLEEAFNYSLASRKSAEDILRKYIDEEDTLQFLMKNLYRADDGQLAWRINVPLIDKNIELIGEGLPEGTVFQGPVCFIKGERSGYIKSSDLDLMLRHFPHSQMLTIANAGHWVHAEQPTALDAEVRVFFKFS
jgi:esterase